MSDLVGNPEDRFSQIEAHIISDLFTDLVHMSSRSIHIHEYDYLESLIVADD